MAKSVLFVCGFERSRRQAVLSFRNAQMIVIK